MLDLLSSEESAADESQALVIFQAGQLSPESMSDVDNPFNDIICYTCDLLHLTNPCYNYLASYHF